MTSFRQRMIEDLHLRGYSERTVEAYVSAVARLAQYYHTAPDRLSEDQLREYLVHLTSVRKLARPSLTVALCGIRFLYERTLGHHWTILDIARPKRDKKLPVVLSPTGWKCHSRKNATPGSNGKLRGPRPFAAGRLTSRCSRRAGRVWSAEGESCSRLSGVTLRSTIRKGA
jgi:hypothetical protein